MFKKKCRECGENVYALDLNKAGICFTCLPRTEVELEKTRIEAEQTAAEISTRAANVLLTTEHTAPGEVRERLGIVATECCLGVSVFRDAFAGVRDIFGGRSEAMQRALSEARQSAINDLKTEVARLGGNCAVAVTIGYEQISPGGGNMLLVTATGTAVRI
ncbi:YbjQ family protein [Paracoccus niistensis]|uniref:UPF0145 protein ACFFII_14180 n=1 Tax=Paracoccus niistensis TaxID=632935 RepID=A0ABV6I6U1_9RHOB